MKKSLTQRQMQFFLAIQEYIRSNGEPPTLKYLAQKFKITESGVTQTLDILAEKGVIKRGEKWAHRAIEFPNKTKKTINIPIVGNVACGSPLLAEENIQGYIPIDKEFINASNKYFFLRAIGDSMDAAGINPDDYILIQQQSNANNGDKVVALIDDEATVKILKKERDFVALLPKSKNKIHKPIILRHNFSILGIVRKIFPKKLIEI